MSSHPFLTVHTLTALPWHNLNRDESGAPKQVTEGGVTRARLSSQSLKRAARVAFERDVEAAERSTRTKVATALIVDRITELRGDVTTAERAKLTRSVAARVNKLTQNSSGAETETVKKDTLVWLSAGELEAMAQAFARGDEADLVTATSTDSLAVAAFGRMFANQPGLSLSSAISVGDAVTTHAATIELDWFTAVDDAETSHAGAGQLGYSSQTTGVYYRSFTIDRAQLARNYDGDLNGPETEAALRALIRHITLALPTGRTSGTAAQTLPAYVLAEEQAHRVVYDFHEPVTSEGAGFLAPSIERLRSSATQAWMFDPTLFGSSFVTGTHAAAGGHSFADYTQFVLDFIRS
jgi:CRISPR system Cascade subunit CasC